MSIHLLRSAPLGLWVLSASFPRGCAWRSGQSHPVSTGNLALSACIQFAYISGLFLAWTWTLKIVVSTGYIIFRTHVSSFLAVWCYILWRSLEKGAPTGFCSLFIRNYKFLRNWLSLPSSWLLALESIAVGKAMAFKSERLGHRLQAVCSSAAHASSEAMIVTLENA